MVQISNTERQRGDYIRQLEKIDSQSRIDAWRELQDANLRLSQIAARVESGRTGADWQRRFLARHGSDLAALTLAYIEQQQGGRPVHEWPC